MGNRVRALGVDVKLGSAMRQCGSHRLSLICGLRACCGACDCPSSPAAPVASSASRPGLCVLLQDGVPASLQGHSYHLSWRQQAQHPSQCLWFPARMTTSFWLAWTFPLLKVKVCHLGNPSAPGKQDTVGRPAPVHPHVLQLVLTLPHCSSGSLPNCLLYGIQGPRQTQRNSLTETASSAPCCQGRTR